MEASIIFTSTVVVLWAVMFIPWALIEDKKYLIAISAVILFFIELVLGRELQDIYMNFLASLFIILLAFAGGLIQHYFNQRRKEKENERAQ